MIFDCLEVEKISRWVPTNKILTFAYLWCTNTESTKEKQDQAHLYKQKHFIYT